MNELLVEHAGPVLAELHKIATEHADDSDDKLVALDYDPATYSNINIMKHTIKGTPLDHIQANEIAASIDARYVSLYQAMSECPGVDVVEDVLLSGQNVILALDHGELIDAALVPLALGNVLKSRKPPEKDKDPYFRTGLIVSRMIEFVGVPLMGGIMPAADLFKLGFERTYQTVPNTISTKGKFNTKALKTYNGMVVSEIEGAIRHRPFTNRRPMLLAMAAPGTINKPLDVEAYTGTDIPPELQDSTMVVGQINYRVADFAKNALTFASIAQLSENTSDVCIDSIPLLAGSPEGIEKLAGRLISLLSNREGDKVNYVYDTDGTLPVVRKKVA